MKIILDRPEYIKERAAFDNAILSAADHFAAEWGLTELEKVQYMTCFVVGMKATIFEWAEGNSTDED